MSRPMMSGYRSPVGLQCTVNETTSLVKDLPSASAGSCNACPSIKPPVPYDTVTEVNMRGLTFRLCPTCANSLKLAL